MMQPLPPLCRLLVISLGAVVSFAQKAKSTSQKHVLSLSARQAIARPTLLETESTAASFDPASRAYLFYRIAGGWLPLEPKHAVSIYRDVSPSPMRRRNPV